MQQQKVQENPLLVYDSQAYIMCGFFLTASNFSAAAASGGAKGGHRVIGISIVAGEIAKQTVSKCM